jgi:hypothetical protein
LPDKHLGNPEIIDLTHNKASEGVATREFQYIRASPKADFSGDSTAVAQGDSMKF